MDIIFLSEHGEPLIGGATHLSSKIASSVSKLGHNVTFIVPNSSSDQDLIVRVDDNLTIVKVRAYVPIDDRSKFKGSNRRIYSEEVNSYLKKHCATHNIDVIQVLSGTYLIRFLEVSYFQNKNILLIAGILNVPPQECALSWKGDSWLNQIKDRGRQLLIKKINKRRLTYNRFDGYTVESEYVKRLLSKYLSADRIKYIPLGTDETSPRLTNQRSSKLFNILTAGGISPSKNQHIIPKIAYHLLKMGLEFQWNIIGPVRNERYYSFVLDQIKQYGVQSCVTLISGMSKDELMKYYESSNLYVQTSIEEGFCMTALDALVFGLPLIGLDTGAIAEFIVKGRGVLVNNSSIEMAEAIKEIVTKREEFKYTAEEIFPIINYYNWSRIASEYIAYYNLLKSQNEE